MKNQTVAQIHAKQQMINGLGVPKHTAQTAMKTKEQNELSKLISSLGETLGQAGQAVKQSSTTYPQNLQLQQADKLLTQAIQEVQKLETNTLTLTNTTKQQLKQLLLQITAASNTLGMIKQAIGKEA